MNTGYTIQEIQKFSGSPSTGKVHPFINLFKNKLRKIKVINQKPKAGYSINQKPSSLNVTQLPRVVPYPEMNRMSRMQQREGSGFSSEENLSNTDEE